MLNPDVPISIFQSLLDEQSADDLDLQKVSTLIVLLYEKYYFVFIVRRAMLNLVVTRLTKSRQN